MAAVIVNGVRFERELMEDEHLAIHPVIGFIIMRPGHKHRWFRVESGVAVETDIELDWSVGA